MSMGIAIYPNDGDSAEVLLRKADVALYRTKKEGRNHVLIYDASVQEK
jgi:GGDEF domain-containing protein